MPRYTMDIDDRFDQTLTQLQERTGAGSKAEVLRKAVALYSVLKNRTAEENNVQTVKIRDVSGDNSTVIVP